MWAGASTMYGIGLKKSELPDFLEYLMKKSSKDESKRFLEFLESEYQVKTFKELQKKKQKDEYAFSYGSILLETDAIFEKTLSSLGLQLGVYPHDIIERFAGDVVVVLGQNVCTLTVGNDIPEMQEIDTKAVLKTLSGIFTAKRCAPTPKTEGRDFPTEKTHIGYYTYPLDCACCT